LTKKYDKTISDAIAGVDPKTTRSSIKEMKNAGARFMTFKQFKSLLK
jgi:hypothetical protein